MRPHLREDGNEQSLENEVSHATRHQDPQLSAFDVDHSLELGGHLLSDVAYCSQLQVAIFECFISQVEVAESSGSPNDEVG